MQHVLQFWYLQSPSWVKERLLSSIRLLDGHFAVRDTLRNLGKPIFQDYTYQGRIIGFFFRILRVLMAVTLYCFMALAYACAYAIWLAFPLICATWIIGSFAGAA